MLTILIQVRIKKYINFRVWLLEICSAEVFHVQKVDFYMCTNNK